MDPNDIAKALISGLVFGGIYVVIALMVGAWRKITNPETAKSVGRGVSRSIKSAAEAVGQATAHVGDAAKEARESYVAGRDSLKGQPRKAAKLHEPGDRYGQLSHLRSLLNSGAMTQVEYEEQKASLLEGWDRADSRQR